jgi:putative redox protein
MASSEDQSSEKSSSEKSSSEKLSIASATQDGGFAVHVTSRGHEWRIDEPVSLGGTNSGATPVEHLAGALGACTATTITMYLQRKGWVARSLSVDVAVDWRVNPPTVARTIIIDADFDDDQQARVAKIADACPVHRIIANASTVTTTWA